MQRFFLFFSLFFLLMILSLPSSFVQKMRGNAALIASSLSAKNTSSDRDDSSFSIGKKESNDFYQLQLENQLLKEQMKGIYEWLTFHERIDQQVERQKELSNVKETDLYWREFFLRRAEDLRKILEYEHQAMPAKVIFREPSSYGSTLWINVGKKNNNSLGRLVIAKNSPVVVGSSLVGVIEDVQEKISKVRLLTDSSFVPSVRATRGKMQDRYIYDLISSFIKEIHYRKDLFVEEEEKDQLMEKLHTLEKKLLQSQKDWYLAKGELHGASTPLWSSLSSTLRGVGFNYDFADEDGSYRDLRTGKSEAQSVQKEKISLIEKGDLLITTGYDGIFPAGLHVATVSKVFPLEEGASFYSIEAKPTCPNLEDLNVLFVLPPLSYDVSSNP